MIQADQHFFFTYTAPTETDTVRAKHNKLSGIIRQTNPISELFFCMYRLFGPEIRNHTAGHELDLMKNHNW